MLYSCRLIDYGNVHSIMTTLIPWCQFMFTEFEYMRFFSGQHSTWNWTAPLSLNKLYTVQDPGTDSTTMGCARRCRSNVKWISTEWSQLCVASVTDCPVPMVCALTSRPVSYPNWLETNIECRLLDMRIWWYLTSFAVCGRTVGAMVW